MDNHPNKQGRKRALSPTQVADIAAKLARGQTKASLALEYGVGIQTIRRSLEREEAPGPMNIELKPCGTNAAYARHIRNHEIACDACLVAHAERRAEDVSRDPHYKEKRRRWNRSYRQRQKDARTVMSPSE